MYCGKELTLKYCRPPLVTPDALALYISIDKVSLKINKNRLTSYEKTII